MTDRTIKLALRSAAALLVAGAVFGAFLLLRPAAPHGPLVVVDAGHGGEFSSTGVGGLKENDLNLAIAKRLRKKLIARGYRVIMTRTSGSNVAKDTIASWSYVGAKGRTWAFGIPKTSSPQSAASQGDLQARVDIANQAGADVFVSVHNNASGDASMRGTETYASRGDAPGQALAASVLDAVVTRTGSPNRGAHGSGLYVCRWTNMPAVLVEGAYFTNEQDAKELKSAKFQDRLADGIAEGIDHWFASYPPRAKEPQRAGPDSVSLACAVSSAAYPKGSQVVVVLPAETTALGPAAATLAAKLGAPLLLTTRTGVPQPTADEVRRLKPDRVIIVGVSTKTDLTAISSALTEATGSRARIETVAENTAPDAAALCAGWITVPANGEVAIADVGDAAALAALAPYVARKRVPLLLSEGGRLGDNGLVFLSQNRAFIKRVIAVGCSKQPAEPDGWSITAVRSGDPDELAARLLARADSATGTRKLAPVAVDAAGGPDVFVAATEAARRKQPLIEFRAGVLGPYSREFLVNRTSLVRTFLILRDAGSIPPVAESSLRKSVGR